jgi:hypothetical protein
VEVALEPSALGVGRLDETRLQARLAEGHRRHRRTSRGIGSIVRAA